MCGAGLSFCQNIHFYVVLSVFSHPCTKKWRRAQFSIHAELTWLSVCVCVCVCAENFSHSTRLLLQQSRASIMLALCLRQSLLEPCKTDGARHAESIRDSIFFFDRSGSGQTRAHLASRLLLCPNTRTPHMYCRKYCYIIIYIKYCYNYYKYYTSPIQ